jgi:RNA polymerase sigma-32 factor
MLSSIIRNSKVLSTEEQAELGARMATDKRARDTMIEGQIKLCQKLAIVYGYDRTNREDLFQEGLAGVIEAADRFDPARNVKFSTYAQWWARAFVLARAIADYSLVKIGTTQAQRKLFFRLHRETSKLLAERGDAAPDAIADRCKVRERDVLQMIERMASPERSLDAPVLDASAHGNGRTLYDALASDCPTPEEYTSSKLDGAWMLGIMAEFEQTLNPREAVVFNRRIANPEPDTLDVIGQMLGGVSRQRIQQIEVSLRARIAEMAHDRI